MAALVSDPALGLPASRPAPSVSAPSDQSDQSDPSDRVRAARKAEVAGNVMLCLINQETYLLGRQIARLAADFEREGGFTERLYRVRSEARAKKPE